MGGKAGLRNVGISLGTGIVGLGSVVLVLVSGW